MSKVEVYSSFESRLGRVKGGVSGVRYTVDTKGLDLLAEAMRVAPGQLVQNLARAYQKMGSGDIAALRKEQLSGGKGLRFKNKGAQKSFKFKATDPGKARDMGDLFVNEYTRWPAAKAHAEGGTIKAKRGAMWMLTHNAKGGQTGKRTWSDAEMKRMVASGRFALVKLARGRMAVIDREAKKNSRKLIAILLFSVRIQKRLDWAGLVERREGEHRKLMGEAVEKTLTDALGGFSSAKGGK